MHDTSQAIFHLKHANLLRTKYLLQNYPRYLSQCPKNLEIRVSKAVLEILSFSLSNRTEYGEYDRDLIDRCGPLLPPAIRATVNEIKQFPIDISSKIYPVLYHQYFAPEGTAVDFKQLLQRLDHEYNHLAEDDISLYLSNGERMMSALLFENRFISALDACP